jgi:hypothetical protein
MNIIDLESTKLNITILYNNDAYWSMSFGNLNINHNLVSNFLKLPFW